MDTRPIHFFDEPIQVRHSASQTYEKTPTCPDGFTWREEYFSIDRLVEEWSDFTRRGKSARNMRPAHLSRASRDGSWGVGRFYFRVLVTGGRIFEIYYDRAVENCDDRKGNWFLLAERGISFISADIKTSNNY
jgi:hypothetical protein